MDFSLKAWKRNMRPASFRGVPFGVSGASDTVGRSTVTHVFPQAAAPYSEDMGPAARFIEVQGFLVGADYMARRDKLIEALNKPGGGELVHPWHGTLYVALAAPAQVTHSAQDGGMCTVQMRFVRVERGQSLTAEPNLLELVAEKAAIASGFAEALADAMDIAGHVAWVTEQAEAALGDMLGAVEKALGFDPLSVLGWASGTASGWLSAVMQAGQLGRNMKALFQAGAGSLSAEGSASAFSSSVAEDRGPSPVRMLALAEAAPIIGEPGRVLGANSAAAWANRKLVAQAWREFASIEACKLAASYLPESKEESAALLQRLLDTVADAQQEANDASFAALADLRAVTVRAMAEKAGQAPELIQVTEALAMPSLVVAWRWTGGIDAEADILRRNGVTHPGFMPAGSVLEVVTDAS